LATSKVTRFPENTGPPVCVNASVNVVDPLLLETVNCCVLETIPPLAKLYAGRADGNTWMVELPPALMLIVTGTDTGLLIAPGAEMVSVPPYVAAPTPVGFTITRIFCGVVLSVPEEGFVAMQPQVEALAIVNVDEPELIERARFAVWLVPFEAALMVKEVGLATRVCACNAPLDPAKASIATAARKLDLKGVRTVLKLISTGDLQGLTAASLQDAIGERNTNW
jgi:hypothetical protein